MGKRAMASLGSANEQIIEQDILHDTYLFGEIIEEGTRVHLVESLENHWKLELYLTRYCDIS